jgi:hypothetical protein
MNKKNWTDSELDRLARALIHKYPSRGFETVMRPHKIELSDQELTPVLHSVIASPRSALRPKLNRLKRDLLQAFMRVTGRSAATPDDDDMIEAVASPSTTDMPAPTGEQEHQATPAADDGDDTGRRRKIHWSGDEWRFYALALHNLCPSLDLLNATDLKGVTARELNMAASMMGEGRQRHFIAVSEVAPRLLHAYSTARQQRDPMFFGKKEGGSSVEAAEGGAAPAAERPPVIAMAGNGEKIFWTAEEYLAIGRELVQQFPNAMEGDLPGLTSGDLARAVNAVLPAHRRRRMANQAHVTSFVRRLRDAIAGRPIWTAEQFVQSGVIATEDQKPDHRTGPRIKWCDEEWDALVRKLHDLEPELEDHPGRLTLARLNEASSMMARPRRFFHVHSTRKMLDDARARISMGQFRRAPAPVDPDLPPIVATMPTRPVVTNPAIPADKLFSKVEWTREEWLAVARELHRLFPSANYPKRGSLTGLDSHDVAFAQQRVLPIERQRRHLKVASFSTLKQPLERAFLDLNEELEGGAKPAPAAPIAQVEPPAPGPQPATAAAAPAVQIPSPAPAAPAAPIAPTADVPAMDPYRAAFAPLVSLLAAEVANQLRPMLTQFVNEAVALALAAQPPAAAASVAPPAEPVVSSPQTPSPAPERVSNVSNVSNVSTMAPKKNYGPETPREEKPRRLVVGVMVNRASQYRAELEKEFPQIEIKIGDVTMNGAAASLANVDKAVCMTRFVDHTAQRNLKKLTGDRYVDCNGGLSELKRIIAIWLKQRAELAAAEAAFNPQQKRA